MSRQDHADLIGGIAAILFYVVLAVVVIPIWFPDFGTESLDWLGGLVPSGGFVAQMTVWVLGPLMAAVAMRRDKVKYRTVKFYFRNLYGDPAEGTDDTWFVRPWYYLKMLTKNYIFLADSGADPLGEGAEKLRDASAVAIYVNMNGLAQIYTELADEIEKQGGQPQ